MKVIKNFEGSDQTVVALTPKEVETLGLMLANEVIGEVGHGEFGLAEGIREVGADQPYWGRADITLEDAGEFAYVLLHELGGFKRAEDVIMDALDPEGATS
jgi:hypothetical protein